MEGRREGFFIVFDDMDAPCVCPFVCSSVVVSQSIGTYVTSKVFMFLCDKAGS